MERYFFSKLSSERAAKIGCVFGATTVGGYGTYYASKSYINNGSEVAFIPLATSLGICAGGCIGFVAGAFYPYTFFLSVIVPLPAVLIKKFQKYKQKNF